MVSSEQIFRRTLSQLEVGLTVELVAEKSLTSFDFRDPVSQIRHIMAEHDFSQAPVMLDGEIVGIVDTDDPVRGVVAGDWMRPLAGKAVISSQTSLRSVIRELATDRRRYRLVVDADGVSGIVTRSDLQKLPVRLLAFTYVTHLEALFADRISRTLRDEQWLDLLRDLDTRLPDHAQRALGPNVGSRVERKLRSDQEQFRKRDATPSLLELTQFSQKWYVVYRAFDMGLDFASEMAGIQMYLRNNVAHTRDYVADDFQLDQLERRLSICEKWIEHFSKSLGSRNDSRPTSTVQSSLHV